jgi:hypothetical protein
MHQFLNPQYKRFATGLVLAFTLIACAPIASLLLPSTPLADPARLEVSGNGFVFRNPGASPVLDTVAFFGGAKKVIGLPRCFADGHGVGCTIGDVPSGAVIRFEVEGKDLSGWASFYRGSELIPATPAVVVSSLPAGNFVPKDTLLGVNLYPNNLPVSDYLTALKKLPMIRAVQTYDAPTVRAMKQAGYVVGAFTWSKAHALELAGAGADYLYLGDEDNLTQTPQQYMSGVADTLRALRDSGYKGDVVASALAAPPQKFLFDFIQLQQVDWKWSLEFLSLENRKFDALAANPFQGSMAEFRRLFTENAPRRAIYHAGWGWQNPRDEADIALRIPLVVNAFGADLAVLKTWHQVRVSSIWTLFASRGLTNLHDKEWGLVDRDTMNLTPTGQAFLQAAQGWVK